MFTKMAVILAIMATLGNTPIENHDVYMRTMRVSELNYNENLVTCIDAEGFIWQFYGCEDYYINDLVSCLMDTVGTNDTIFDDVILMTSYTGYYIN